MKKLIFLTTAFVIFIVFVLPFIAALLIKMIPANDQPGYFLNTRGIYGQFSVSQEFTSTDNNLTAIGTSLGNPNLKNKAKIIFTLLDSSGVPVRTSLLSGMNVGDGAFVKFVFEPIADSKSKKYTFTISSPDAGEEEIINVFVSADSTDFIGPATYGEEILEKGLPIVVYFKPVSHLQVAKDIFSSWAKRVF